MVLFKTLVSFHVFSINRHGDFDCNFTAMRLVLHSSFSLKFLDILGSHSLILYKHNYNKITCSIICYKLLKVEAYLDITNRSSGSILFANFVRFVVNTASFYC